MSPPEKKFKPITADLCAMPPPRAPLIMWDLSEEGSKPVTATYKSSEWTIREKVTLSTETAVEFQFGNNDSGLDFAKPPNSRQPSDFFLKKRYS